MKEISNTQKIFRMLFFFTLLFVIAQLTFFIIHYAVSELIDTLVNSSISRSIFYPVNVFPVLAFIIIQIIAYVIFGAFIAFITISLSELFRLSKQKVIGVTLFLWICGCIAILTLNAYYYPNSFFAQPFVRYPWASNSALLISISILSATTVLAYCNLFWHKHPLFLGLFFIVISCLIGVSKIYENSFLIAKTENYKQEKPDVILIGLDSVRPDFLGFFAKREMNTPHIDAFLKSATVFTDAYTPLGRTFPAWVSILTARYPKHHHARVNIADPQPIIANDTLAKRLQLAGYETVYATDESRFSDINKEYGFDRIIGPKRGIFEFILGGLSDFPLANLLINLPLGRYLFPYQYGNRAANITYRPDAFLHLLEIALAQRERKPLFLSVHLCLSHWPYYWADKHYSEDTKLPFRYAASVEAVDQQLGKLMQLLAQAGLLKHSLVVLLSDHGISLGMPDDRVIDKKNYLDEARNLRQIKLFKLSSAPTYSMDFRHDYTINTSYGTGTDVLSLTQYRVLLAFKRFGEALPKREINQLTTLLDIAPTVLDMLQLDPLKKVDGVSLTPFFSSANTKFFPPRPVFLETADSFGELETDKIIVEKLLRQSINAYFVDPTSGRLRMNPIVEKSIIKGKQRAVLSGEWLLARYPAMIGQHLVKENTSKNNRLEMKQVAMDPYFVLVNLKTSQWTTNLASPFAKRAGVASLLEQLKLFYGKEILTSKEGDTPLGSHR